jgi:hypothetical protein
VPGSRFSTQPARAIKAKKAASDRWQRCVLGVIEEEVGGHSIEATDEPENG